MSTASTLAAFYVHGCRSQLRIFRTADVERDWVDVPLGRLEGVSQKYPGWFTWNNHFL
jgi:hypothetical protein